MKGVGTDIGIIHFVGIGGIGMSGIAEVMHNLGYTVQGSDASDNANVRRIAAKGMRTFVGHDAAIVSIAVDADGQFLFSGGD